MGEVLIECSKCGMEMKYSLLKTHICPGHKTEKIEKFLEELLDEILDLEDSEA